MSDAPTSFKGRRGQALRQQDTIHASLRRWLPEKGCGVTNPALRYSLHPSSADLIKLTPSVSRASRNSLDESALPRRLDEECHQHHEDMDTTQESERKAAEQPRGVETTPRNTPNPPEKFIFLRAAPKESPPFRASHHYDSKSQYSGAVAVGRCGADRGGVLRTPTPGTHHSGVWWCVFHPFHTPRWCVAGSWGGTHV